MSTDFPKNHTALVVLDVISTAVAHIGEDSPLIKRLSSTLATARKAGIRVIHVTIHFREGYPEVNPRNRIYSRMLKAGILQSADLSIHSAVAPEPGDVVVTKTRTSAFSGTDLEVILRSQAISHLVLCGIPTSNAVLSTLLQAADKDYELTVLSDCCTDKEDVQHVLMSEVFPQWAEVITAEAWEKRVSEGVY